MESGFNLSALFQGVAATGLGYLDRRLDIDLERRLTRATEPKVSSTQTPIQMTVPNQLFGVPTSTLLPLLIIGAVVLIASR